MQQNHRPIPIFPVTVFDAKKQKNCLQNLFCAMASSMMRNILMRRLTVMPPAFLHLNKDWCLVLSPLCHNKPSKTSFLRVSKCRTSLDALFYASLDVLTLCKLKTRYNSGLPPKMLSSAQWYLLYWFWLVIQLLLPLLKCMRQFSMCTGFFTDQSI